MPPIAVLGLVATVAAATFHPMQVVFRGVVDELLFGVRPDPLDAAGLVSERIGDDPIVALRAIREALVLPYAALRVDDEVTAASGTRSPRPRSGRCLAHRRLAGARGRPAGRATSPSPPPTGRCCDIAAPLLAQSLRARALAADLL